MQMYIQWHEPKRRTNLHEHGVDFALLEGFFDGELLTREDVRYEYPESRFQSVGLLGSLAYFVVWTAVGASGDIIHLISARKATSYETQTWFAHYATRH